MGGIFDRKHRWILEVGKKLWNLPVPQKMKYFLWRMCKNNIPVRNLLRGRGVQTTIICPMCNSDVEHVRHIFVECQHASNYWDCLGRDFDTIEIETVSSWILEKLGTELEGKLIKLVKIFWGIWWARNKKVWDNSLVPPLVAMETSSRIVAGCSEEGTD